MVHDYSGHPGQAQLSRALSHGLRGEAQPAEDVGDVMFDSLGGDKELLGDLGVRGDSRSGFQREPRRGESILTAIHRGRFFKMRALLRVEDMARAGVVVAGRTRGAGRAISSARSTRALRWICTPANSISRSRLVTRPPNSARPGSICASRA